MNNLPERMLAWRTKRGWSQQRAATEARVSISTWRNWEKGIMRPDVRNGETLAALLALPTESNDNNNNEQQ